MVYVLCHKDTGNFNVFRSFTSSFTFLPFLSEYFNTHLRVGVDYTIN
nr:MAG TPA: hypothetical protein [Caudoviricetes sp.]